MSNQTSTGPGPIATPPKRWRATTLPDLLQEQESTPPRTEDVYGRYNSAGEWRPSERGWLLRSGAADLLAPFASLQSRPGDPTIVHNIDQHTARTLLDLLPEKHLAERRTNYGPTTADILTTVANQPGTVAASGYLMGADRADEGISLRSVSVHDPALIAFTPDVLPGHPLDLNDLPEDQLADYLEHQAGCLVGSVKLQQWFAVRHLYGLRTALTSPWEIAECWLPALNGYGVQLWWK